MLRFGLISGALALLAAVAAVAQDPSPAAGKVLTVEHKCAMCHVIEGKGGKLSTSLDGVAARRDKAALRRILTDPLAAFPDAKIKMPRVPWKPGELDAVVAYLATLKSAPAK